MNIAQIEKNLAGLVKNISKESFIYDLLLAYGVPKATVSLLKKGKRNLSKRDDQIILKKKMFFQELDVEDLHATIDTLKKDEATHRHDPRFIIVTNYNTLLAVDTKTGDTLDIKIGDIVKHPFFFGPWAKIEKTAHANENPADVKAAEKMAKIYDEILQDNEFETKDDLHGLNIFLSRLLFCFFAEDTGIFDGNAFTNAISSHTQDDGSDLQEYLNKLFEVLNTQDRQAYPEYLHDFPYVNGGLFGDSYNAPIFSRKARQMIVECGELDWQDINPDIFGSMFQAVVHKDQRSNMGMHYTSVPNIMKVIEPLFLNELKEEFEKHYDNQSKLKQLLTRLGRLRIFDPACGSGNFLIIAYKEIRTLEMQIFQRIQEITTTPSLPFSCITLSQFYGIELDDFAHEVAILSLWLAEHQMNVAFKAIFGQANPTLPLKEGGKIVCANATRIPWEDVCPKDKDAEIYILGNPPYLGAALQNSEQQTDKEIVCSHLGSFKKLDYIACWFVLGSQYIQNRIKAKFAFVSTNSICQGEQTHLLWPYVFSNRQHIFFAHQSFKWGNSAKKNAGVTCVIIGIKEKGEKDRLILFNDNISSEANSISPYLTNGHNITVAKRAKPLSQLPPLIRGSIPYDDGNLMLTDEEKNNLISHTQETDKYLKQAMGAAELFNGIKRWCLWITESESETVKKLTKIKERIDKCKVFRAGSSRKAMNDLSKTPYRFGDIRYQNKPCIIVPRISSEKRKYLPIDFLSENVVILDSAYSVATEDPYIFGFLSSKIHMTWVRAVAGQLETRIRYSSNLCYNTFPVPDLTEKQKQSITTHVYNVLEERGKHSEKTMAQLYDPDKMPDGLRQAHHDLDIAVERCYRSKPFTSDEERLEYLFKLYEEMTSKESAGGLL